VQYISCSCIYGGYVEIKALSVIYNVRVSVHLESNKSLEICPENL
jgi:hypothetical protein